jgi:hypothetical protein
MLRRAPPQLSQVLLDFGSLVPARRIYFQIFDLPDDRGVVKDDQKVA